MFKKYKLIKWFPESPPIGTIYTELLHSYSTAGYGLMDKMIVEGSPEFWEKIVEKEWALIEFTTDIELPIPAIFDWCIWRDLLKIKSIIRKNDNTIFSIGDKIKVSCHEKNEFPEIITKIELNKEGNPCLFTSKFCNNGIDLIKAVKYEKIITTDDGVDLYKNDYFWHVDPYFSVSKGVLDTTCPEFKPSKGYKHFSTEKAAKDWIEMNKPQFSLKDIKKASMGLINLEDIAGLVYKLKLK